MYSTTKVSLFVANYSKELRMEANMKRNVKVKKAIEFVERMNKVKKEVGVALKKAQEEIKKQVGRKRKEVEKWNKSDRVTLSMKDLVFKE